MAVEYLGEKIFLEEIEASGQVWVARSVHKNIYIMELERSGVSLPVWSSRERVESYLKNAHLTGPKYKPDAVPRETLTRTWLSDASMGIVELLINPEAKATRVLVMTPEEFVASQEESR